LWRYWGVLQSVEKIVTVTQLVNMTTQSLTTKDGKSLMVSGVIRYEVFDVKLALLAVHDYDKALPDEAEVAVSHFVTRNTAKQCFDLGQIEKDVEKRLKREAKKWGVLIQRFKINEIAKQTVITVNSRGGNVPTVLTLEDEE